MTKETEFNLSEKIYEVYQIDKEKNKNGIKVLFLKDVKEFIRLLKKGEISFLTEFEGKSKKEMIVIICKRDIELKNNKDRIDKLAGNKLC